MNAAQPDFRDEELLAAVVADLIGDVRHVAVGNASPIPATAVRRLISTICLEIAATRP